MVHVPAAIFDFLMRNKYRLDEDIVYNNHRATSAYYLMEKASDGIFFDSSGLSWFLLCYFVSVSEQWNQQQYHHLLDFRISRLLLLVSGRNTALNTMVP